MPRCSTVPELEVPPGIVPSGMYVVVVDINGDSKMLARITSRGILYFDGNDIFLADGSDELPLILPEIPTVDTTMFGLLAKTTNGRWLNLVNEGEEEKTLRSKLGQLYFGTDPVPTGDEDFMVPNTPDGFGLLVRQPAAPEPEFFGLMGLIWIQADKTVTQLPLGNEGQILKIVGGTPQFATPSSGNVSAGSGLSSLDGVKGRAASAATVTITAPKLILSDGSTTVNANNVNVLVNLASAAGLLALDVGVEAANRWYYIYVLSDGTNVSACISEQDDGPDPTNLGAYTFWGLASVFRNNASGNITDFVQKGRDFWTPAVEMSDNVPITTAFAPVPQTAAMSTILPPLVRVARGIAGGAVSAPMVSNVSMQMASDGSGLALHVIGSTSGANSVTGFSKDAGMFQVPILDPLAQALYWKGSVNENHRRIVFTGYSI